MRRRDHDDDDPIDQKLKTLNWCQSVVYLTCVYGAHLAIVAGIWWVICWFTGWKFWDFPRL